MVLNCLQNVENCVTSRAFSSNEVKSEKTECESPPEKENLEPEYNPHDYGKEHYPTIFWGPIFHLLKTVIGTGVLALPYTFKSVGYSIAIVSTFIIGYVYVHVLHMLLQVEYYLCKSLKVPNLTYLGVVEHSFKQGPSIFRKLTPIGKFLVYFHYVINKSLANTVYLITIGNNFKILIDYYYGTDLKLITIMTICIIPLILLSSIRNLKFLAPLSMMSYAFNIFGVVLILVISNNYNGWADLKPVTDISQFPSFFGIVLGSLHATGIILPLKNDMKNPARFSKGFGVLNIAMSISTVAYCAFGFLAYAKYGEQLQPNVLYNLPTGSLISRVVILFYSLALFISFTLYVYIGFDTLWSNIFINKKLKYPTLIEYSIRYALVILPYCTAVLLPDFRIMVMASGLIGIVMDEAVPPILHILMLMKMKERSVRVYMIILKDIGFILISLFLFVAALMTVIDNIIAFYTR